MRIGCSAAVGVLLGGCNPLLGLDPTHAIDAAYFDAPPDAPYGCPSTGTLPRFSRQFRQAVLQDCTQYSLSLRAGTALARCADNYYEGQVDGALTLALGLQSTGAITIRQARLGPDGDVAIVSFDESATRKHTFAHRTGAAWVLDPIPVDSAGRFLVISTPTRGPAVHLVGLTPTGMHELVQLPDQSWRDAATYSNASLHLSGLGGDYLNLSPDGLRLVYLGASFDGAGLLYSDRATLADAFGPFRPLEPVEFVGNAQLTEDCERLYFSALGTVWFAQHE
jgi:hypothetical protein